MAKHGVESTASVPALRFIALTESELDLPLVAASPGKCARAAV
jgi:hypothetical protein